MNVRTSLIALAAIAAGCSPAPSPEVAQPGPAPAVAPVQVDTMPAASAPAPAPAPSLQEATKPPPAPTPAPVVTYKGAFATPESVLYDPVGDRYLVTNINGKPDGAGDNNGFISELSPDGTIKTPKLIAGGEKGAKLDAPKGSAIVRGELWVSDISVVRKFDLKTLAYKGDIALPGATFANDMVLGPDGRVFVSDSSVKVTDKGFESNNGDQVLAIDKNGKVKVVAKMKELGGPNGLFFSGKDLLVNTLQSDELFRLSDDGKKEDVTKLPRGGLDGLLVVGDTVLCSSWGASTIYKGKLGGSFEPVVQNVKGPADFGWDSKRHRILVPRFMEDAVEVYEVALPAATAAKPADPKAATPATPAKPADPKAATPATPAKPADPKAAAPAPAAPAAPPAK